MITTFPLSTLPSAFMDDERRAPAGLTDRERCPQCHGAIDRTDASGLCWRCMPC